MKTPNLKVGLAQYAPVHFNKEATLQKLKSIIEDLSAIAQKEEGLSRIRNTEFSMSALVEEVAGRQG